MNDGLFKGGQVTQDKFYCESGHELRQISKDGYVCDECTADASDEIHTPYLYLVEYNLDEGVERFEAMLVSPLMGEPDIFMDRKKENQ